MPDVLAIVSKAVFEKEAGGRKPGKVWPIDTYHSQSKALAPLASGGRLFLVTVRPPADTLWLVAVLENPQNNGKGWRSGRNRVPIHDISSLVPRIQFANGKGITASPGTLGMSLQTPRLLDAPSAALLFGAAWSSGVAPAVNVTKHDPAGPLPCLCKECFPQSTERAETGGMAFLRSNTEALGRVLHFWMPEELKKEADAVGRSVRAALASRLAVR
ncbi:hypothetical protein [Polyangium sp. 6x1]|uniref:hypothetical protein n=1 Tax=Polyangium sp. 6x1 TaxID=3042689 RepID=UPI002482FCA1|nr:hypothetical protein [Polyangium sp. 6x1]MDI1450183.1 hypothetical protein [Polyangium sp. 6x1]